MIFQFNICLLYFLRNKNSKKVGFIFLLLLEICTGTRFELNWKSTKSSHPEPSQPCKNVDTVLCDMNKLPVYAGTLSIRVLISTHTNTCTSNKSNDTLARIQKLFKKRSWSQFKIIDGIGFCLDSYLCCG